MAPQLRLKSLRREDYAQAPAWFDALLFSLNQMLSDVGGALNGGLTLAENHLAELKTFEVTMPSEFPTWHMVGATGEPPFQNGFTNFGGGFNPVSFRLWPDGIVEIRGFAKQPPAGSTVGLVMFTLPPGYRPNLSYRFPTVSQGAGLTASAAVIQVSTNGQVFFNESVPLNGGWVQLDTFRFQANAVAAKADKFAAPFPVTVKTSGRFVAKTCQVVQVVDKTDSTAGVMGPAQVDWQSDTAGVKLHAIWGLQPGRKYDVTLLITAG